MKTENIARLADKIARDIDPAAVLDATARVHQDMHAQDSPEPIDLDAARGQVIDLGLFADELEVALEGAGYHFAPPDMAAIIQALEIRAEGAA